MIVNTYQDLDSLDKIIDGESQQTVFINDVQFDFFAHIKSSKKLCFLFQGAVDREKRQLPIFHRWSWSNEINASVVVINDPTLYLNKSLRIGWMFGNKSSDYRFLLKQLIDKIIKIAGVSEKDIAFCGSSAGGFVALYMGSYYPSASCFVNNPQTSILEYKKKHVSDFLKQCLDGISKEEALLYYGERLSILQRYQKRMAPKVIYYQNKCDSLHWEKHFTPFVNEVLKSNILVDKFEFHVYTNERCGHEPMPKSKFIKALNVLF